MRCLAGRVFVLVGLMVGGTAMWGQAAAGPQPLVSIPDVVDENGYNMAVTKGPCMGTCPVYYMQLQGDGQLLFNGGANVLIPGNHFARVPPALARTFLERFRKANFAASESYYPVNEDDTYATVVLRIGPKWKTVGGRPTGEIGEIQADLEKLVARWVTGDDETGATLAREGWSFSAATPENIGVYSKAVFSKQQSLIRKYLSAPGPIFSLDGMKLSPICVATELGDMALVLRMIASSENADTPKAAMFSMPADAKYECVSAAAASGNVPLFNFWLKRGAPLQPPPTDSPGGRARSAEWWSLKGRQETPRWNPRLSLVSNGLTSDSLPMVHRVLAMTGRSPKEIKNGLEAALRSMDPKAKDGRELQIVQLLLSAGATVTEGQLYVAAGYQGLERVAIIRLLLTHDVDKKDPAYSALAQAVRMGGPGAAKTVRLLLDAGADLHKVNHVAGPTVLFDASCLPEPLQKQMDQSLYEEVPGVCAPEVVKPLVRRGLDLNAVNTDGYTALTHFAAREGMVRELLADGADPTIVGKDGRGAREIAETYGCAACVVLIDEAVKKRVPGGR